MALNWYQGQGNTTQKPSKTYNQVSGPGLPGHASGWDMYQTTRNLGVDALQQGFTGPNEQDIVANDALRDYWTGALGNLGNVSQNRQSQFDTQAQRGLSNLLSQHKSSQAGTGLIGSRQASNQAGDITQRLAGEYARGVTANNQAELGSASQIQSGLGGVRNVDLQERDIQRKNAQSLSDYYTNIGRAELGWQQHTDSQPEKTSWLQDIAPLLGTVGGALLGGPAGAMIGGQLGGAVAGGGGKAQGAQSGSNLAQLMMMQNQQGSVGGGLPVASSAPSGAQDWGSTWGGSRATQDVWNNPYAQTQWSY
jgi:hypothetical protein